MVSKWSLKPDALCAVRTAIVLSGTGNDSGHTHYTEKHLFIY